MRVCATIGFLEDHEPAPRQVTAGFLSRMAGRGHQVDIYTPETPISRAVLPGEVRPASVHTYPARLDRIWPSAGWAIRDLVQGVRDADVLYCAGVWDWNHVVATWAARRAGRPYVIAPHECLNPGALRIKKVRKEVARRLFIGRMIREAGALHALTDQEAAGVAPLTKGRVVVHPFGLDYPTPPSRSKPDPKGPLLVFLGRIVPNKRLELAFQLLKRLRTVFPGARLSVAGTGPQGYVESLKMESERMRISDAVSWHGWVEGEGKWNVLRSADLQVIPSTFEGASVAMLEGLSQGTPALRTQETVFESMREGAGVVWLPASEWGTATGLDTVRLVLEEHERHSSAACRYIQEQRDWKTLADRFEGMLSRFVNPRESLQAGLSGGRRRDD